MVSIHNWSRRSCPDLLDILVRSELERLVVLLAIVVPLLPLFLASLIHLRS